MEAIQPPITGKPPKPLSIKTKRVEIITKPMVTPKAQPIPPIKPFLKVFIFDMVDPRGFEPLTFCVPRRRSNQLSYEPR